MPDTTSESLCKDFTQISQSSQEKYKPCSIIAYIFCVKLCLLMYWLYFTRDRHVYRVTT